MSRRSVKSYNYSDGGSAFTWHSPMGPRTFIYRNGVVTIPTIPTQIAVPIKFWEWLTADVERWIATITEYDISAPSFLKKAPARIDYEIADAPSGFGLFDVSLSLSAHTTDDLEYTATVVQPGGVVSIGPAPVARLSWPTMREVNRLYREIVTSAYTGARSGDEDPAPLPLASWPIGSVMWRKDAVNPSTLVGGTWVAVANGNINPLGGGLYWNWIRTA